MRNKRRTKSNDFAEVPSDPMIVQGVVACGWTHFTDARGQRVYARPCCFDLLTDCSPCTLHIAQVEIFLTSLAVAIDMPSRDSHVDLSRIWNLHSFREFFHSFSEILRPLTDDVICDNDAEERDAYKGGENGEIYAAISK
jgi:hypothetical protein